MIDQNKEGLFARPTSGHSFVAYLETLEKVKSMTDNSGSKKSRLHLGLPVTTNLDSGYEQGQLNIQAKKI